MLKLTLSRRKVIVIDLGEWAWVRLRYLGNQTIGIEASLPFTAEQVEVTNHITTL